MYDYVIIVNIIIMKWIALSHNMRPLFFVLCSLVFRFKRIIKIFAKIMGKLHIEAMNF